VADLRTTFGMARDIIFLLYKKVNLPLCLANKELRHEDIWESGIFLLLVLCVCLVSWLLAYLTFLRPDMTFAYASFSVSEL
jgi:hypothetical protein